MVLLSYLCKGLICCWYIVPSISRESAHVSHNQCQTFTASTQELFSMHTSHWLKWGFYMFKGSRSGAVLANDPCLHSRGQGENSWLSNSITRTPYTAFFIPFWFYIANDYPHKEGDKLFFSQGITKPFFFSFSLLHSDSWEFSPTKVSQFI